MAKYQGANRIDDTDQTSYSEEFNATTAQEDNVEPANAEDASFKKRYGDLRRHMQQTLAQKDKELDKMKSQLETAARGQIKFPKTDEEIEQWSKKYPDVAKIVDTIARKRANEALEEGERRLAGLKELETKIGRKEAEQQLLSLHPDFPKIRADSDFHDWVALQPQYIQDALYKNSTDAKAAARAIDLYKADKGIRKKPATKRDAAQAAEGPRGQREGAATDVDHLHGQGRHRRPLDALRHEGRASDAPEPRWQVLPDLLRLHLLPRCVPGVADEAR